jgi:cystathionine beta-lyase/cystathionine gamma-synthase
MDKPMKGIDTRLIHAGEPQPRIEGAVSMPIFQSSTFEYRGEDSYYALRYIRLNNTPNHIALHAKLAAIEGAEAALVTASGMAAVATTLMTIAAAGDRIMAQDCLYGGTHDLMRLEFPRMNLGVDFIDAGNAASWREHLTPQTHAIYVETISNPLMQVADLRAAIAFARDHGLVSIIDNTFASPVNFRPPELGFDLSIHSATKYLNGHRISSPER